MPKQGENISKAVLKARADWEAYTEKQLEHIYKIYEESAKRIDDVIRKYGKDNWRSDYLYGIKNSIKKEMAQLREKLKFQIQNGMKNSVDYGLKQGMRNAYELIGDERRIKLGTSYISKSGKIVKWDMRKDTVDTALWTKINRNALDSVIKFSENVSGLTFSENIWKELERTQRQIRKAIVKGLIEGRSPDQLSRDVRGFLHQPKKLFRRVRDKKGKLRLSKAAKEYKPGTGTYRSSYMNAMRLARTEYSRAYNEGIQRYAEKKDFIKGYIWRTGSGNPCPDCSDLDGTYFPKDAPPALPEHP
ncbi:MAG: hypothetical protein KGY74_09065, partial [Candidatus Cloacimonetes bacterium]|nr:hypothetical protein [Candidatus Cloacimonadota bacterium]